MFSFHFWLAEKNATRPSESGPWPSENGQRAYNDRRARRFVCVACGIIMRKDVKTYPLRTTAVYGSVASSRTVRRRRGRRRRGAGAAGTARMGWRPPAAIDGTRDELHAKNQNSSRMSSHAFKGVGSSLIVDLSVHFQSFSSHLNLTSDWQ